MTRKPHPVGNAMTPSRTRLGQFLRERRLTRGHSQTGIGYQAGLSQTVVSQLEIGTRRYLSARQLVALAAALGCRPSHLAPLLRPATVSEPKTDLGWFIRRRRLALGLTFEDVARRMKLSPKTALNLELKDRPTILYQQARLLAPALELPITALEPFMIDQAKAPTNDFGRRIRARRQALCLSLGEVAHRIGVKKQHMSMIELGRCRCTYNHRLVARLAHELGLDLKELRRLQPGRMLHHATRQQGSLGEYLTNRRLALGLSQQGLARKSKIRNSTISQVESGAKAPTPRLLRRLLIALNCELPSELLIQRRTA